MVSRWKLYKKFAITYRNSGFYIFVALFMALLHAVSTVAIPYLNKVLIDQGVIEKNISVIYKTGILLVSLFLLGVLMNRVQELVFARERNRLLIRMKENLMRKILFANHRVNSKSAGDLLSRIEHDPLEIFSLFIDKPIHLLVTVVTIVIILALTFKFSPTFAMLCIGLMSLVGFMAIFASKHVLAFSAQMKEQNGQRSGLVNNILLGRELIKLSNREDHEVVIYRNSLLKYFSLVMKNVFFRSAVDGCVGILSGLPAYLVLIVGGIYVIKGQTTLGTLVALSMYFNRLISMTSRLFSMNFNWQPAFASLQRIYKILDIPEEHPTDGKKPVSMIQLKDKIEFSDVSFSYENGKRVLDRITLTIPKGQITAIVGASGVGKTTIIRLILKLIEPCSGQILWDGTNHNNISNRSIREVIGLVPQDPYLFNRTVGENILYRVNDPSEKERTVAHNLLREFGLSRFSSTCVSQQESFAKPITELAGNISAGEKQRLAIIRELLNNPEVLVWDEATANIDSKSEKAVTDKLVSMLADKTIIIIAHRFSTVQLADNIIVLKNGRIIGQGSPDDIAQTCSHYLKIFADQIDYKHDAQEPSVSRNV